MTRSKTLAALLLLVSLVLAERCVGQVVIVSSDFNDSVQMYTLAGASLGSLVPPGGGGLDSPQGIAVGPDGNVYVSSGNTDQVLRYAPNGTPLGQFQIAGGLDQPWYLTFGPDQNLYVSSSLTSQVLCYNGTTGTFIRVAAQGHGLLQPDGLSFDASGNLLVSDFATSGRVLKYNPLTGNWISNVVVDASLQNPLQNRLSPDGTALFVSSFSNNQIRKYDVASGAFLGTYPASPLNGPVGQLPMSDGSVLVTSWNNSAIYRYDQSTNAYLGQFTAGGLLNHPNNLALLNIPEPGSATAMLVFLLLAGRKAAA